MAKKKKTNNDALQPQTVSEAEEMLDRFVVMLREHRAKKAAEARERGEE